MDVSLAGSVLDPTGSTIGTVLALLAAVAALVVLLRWWFQNRDR